MEPTDLTIRVLQEIRDETRATRTELKEEIHGLRTELKAEIHELGAEMRNGLASTNARSEVIETVLRDLAQQMVMLSRGIKSALEVRTTYEERISSLEHRVEQLEKPSH